MRRWEGRYDSFSSLLTMAKRGNELKVKSEYRSAAPTSPLNYLPLTLTCQN
jgi:hypothetical protein